MRTDPKALGEVMPLAAHAAGEQAEAAELNNSPTRPEALPLSADWEPEGTVVAPDVQARLIRCITELDSSHQAKLTQVKRLAARLQRVAVQSQKVGIERQRLKEEINDLANALDRTLNLLQPSVAVGEGQPGASDLPDLGGEFDLTTVLRQVIERATRRIGTLCNELKDVELSQSIAAAQILHLQAQVAALGEDKRVLDEQTANLRREISGLRTQNGRQTRQTATAVVQARRLLHEQQHSLGLFSAGLPGYAAYAESVDHDPRRLLTFLLLNKICDSEEVAIELKQHAEQIADIFDPIFYLTKYRDVAADGSNPLLHYVETGWREARRPHLLFDIEYYRHQVGNIAGDLLRHYATVGVFEGRKPHPLLDGAYYSANNPDVAATRKNPIFHYDLWGGARTSQPFANVRYEIFFGAVRLAGGL